MTRRWAVGIGALVVAGAIAVVVVLVSGGSPRRHPRVVARAPAPSRPAAARTPPVSAAPRRGGTLLALASDDFISLDPGQAYDALDYEVVFATQRPLYSFLPAATSRLTADLASGPPQITGGGHVVTVHIRQGVHFSPPVNREVTSADVAYAIERGANPNVATPYFHAYFGDLVGAARADGGAIAGITTPNRFTIVFHLDEPIGAFFAQALCRPISAPVPESYALPHDRRHPSDYEDYEVATGPYMLANNKQGDVLGVGWLAHESAILVRNPDWRASTDFRPAYLNRIEIALNGDSEEVALHVLQDSDAVQLNAPDAASAAAALSDYPMQIHTVADAGVQYASLNMVGPFADVNVRRALYAAVDRNSLVTTLGASEPSVPATHFIYPGVPGFTLAGGYTGPRFPFNLHPGGDLSVARSYMRQAGFRSGRYDGRSVVHVIAVDAVPGATQAKIFNSALHELGFKTKLTLTGEANAHTLCGDTHAVATVCPNLGHTRDFDDPATVIAPIFGSVPIRAVQSAIAGALKLGGHGRVGAWAAVDRLLVSDAVAIPFAFQNVRVIESSDVHGVLDRWDPGIWDLSFTYLTDAPPSGVRIIA